MNASSSSRSERKRLQRREAEALALPLNLASRDPRSIALHVRHVAHLLRDPKARSPSTDAVRHITSLFDRSIPAPAQNAIACRKGCSHCCTQMVTLTAPEAFFVAAQLRDKPEVIAAIHDANAKTRGLTMEQRLRTGLMCAFLKDHACSIYGSRPLGCHGFVSVDLNACIAAFVNGAEPNIPMPGEFVQALYANRILLMAALRLAGLPDVAFEMNEALSAILLQENAEARWYAGEDIFAGVATLPPPPPEFETSIRQMAAFVAPML